MKLKCGGLVRPDELFLIYFCYKCKENDVVSQKSENPINSVVSNFSVKTVKESPDAKFKNLL